MKEKRSRTIVRWERAVWRALATVRRLSSHADLAPCPLRPVVPQRVMSPELESVGVDAVSVVNLAAPRAAPRTSKVQSSPLGSEIPVKQRPRSLHAMPPRAELTAPPTAFTVGLETLGPRLMIHVKHIPLPSRSVEPQSKAPDSAADSCRDHRASADAASPGGHRCHRGRR